MSHVPRFLLYSLLNRTLVIYGSGRVLMLWQGGGCRILWEKGKSCGHERLQAQ